MPLDVTPIAHPEIRAASSWPELAAVADRHGLQEDLSAPWTEAWYDAELPNSWSDPRARSLRGMGLEQLREVLLADGVAAGMKRLAGEAGFRALDRAFRVYLSRGLTRIRREGRTLDALQQLGVEEIARGVRGGLDAPSGHAELLAWLHAFGLAACATWPVSRLVEHPVGWVDKAWVRSHGDLPLAKALLARSYRGTTPDFAPDAVPVGVQTALREELRWRAVGSPCRARSQNTEPLPPTDGPRSEAFERLMEARAWLLRGEPPPRSADWEDGSIFWRSDPPSCTVSFPYAARHVEAVEIFPRAPVEEVVRCACTGPARRGCPDAIRAVCLSMSVLASPPTPEAEAAFDSDLARPAHLAAFAAFDRALDEHGVHRPDAPVAPEPLGWRLDPTKKPWRLVPVRCKPRGRGGWSAAKVTTDELRREAVRLELPVDRAVAARVAPSLIPDGDHFATRAENIFGALPLLADHPRVFLGSRGAKPLSIRTAALTLGVEKLPDGGVELIPRLAGRTASPSEIGRLARHPADAGPAPLLDEARATCVLVSISPACSALLRILEQRGLRYDATAAEPFLRRLPRIERAVPVELADALRGRRIESEEAFRVRLDPADGLGLSIRLRPMPGGPVVSPGEGAEILFGEIENRRVHIVRDLADERRRRDGLATALGLAADRRSGPSSWFLEDEESIATAVDGLRGRDDLRCEWTGRRRLRVHRPGGLRDLSLRVRELDGWFHLDGTLTVDDRDIPLSDVLLALEQGRRYVRLAGDDWLALDASVRGPLEEASAAAIPRRGGRAVSPLHVPALEALRNGGASIEAPESFTRLGTRVEEAASLYPEVPESLRASLRPYQEDGFRWAARLAHWAPGAVLADDMGLGKTVQAIALLLHRASAGPALVVAPTSVGFNWIRELKRFGPSLSVELHRGPRRAASLLDRGPGSVVVTSWDLLVRDMEHIGAVCWNTVVFDEAQAVKTSTTRRARAAREIHANFRLALTGTPLENHAGELWSLFHTVVPGLLGSAQQFRQRWGGLVARGDVHARAALALAIRPFLLRRLKADVAPELPPRTEIELRLALPRDARRAYEAAREAAVQRLEAARAHRGAARSLRFQALADLTRLRRLACHPALVDPESQAGSVKLETLRDLIQSLRREHHQTLVFSQFVGLLKLARVALEADGSTVRWIDGSTSAGARQAEVDRFQQGHGDVFLISLKAGGVGLNLTSADYVIHLDPWWNPAAEDQATDRAHRIGQERPVTVYRLVAEDTVEDGVLELQEAKRALVGDLLAGTGRAAPFAMEELMLLMTRGAKGLDDDGTPFGANEGA